MISTSAICSFLLPLDEDLAFWARHGIRDVGVSIAKLEAYGWDAGRELVVRSIREEGLRVDNLIGLGSFRLYDDRNWPQSRDRIHRAIETATEFACTTVVLTTGPAGRLPWDEAADALEAALAPLVAAANAAGVVIAIEHTNSLRVDVGFVHTLRDAVDLARRLGTGVCMEVNACWAERGLDDTIRNGIDRIALVQLSDFAVGTLSTPARLVPGDGDIPIERIVGVLLDAGYAGTFDLELIGPRIEEEGYDAAVPRALVVTRQLLNRAQVRPATN